MAVLIFSPIIILIGYIITICIRMYSNKNLKKAIMLLNDTTQESWKKSTEYLQRFLSKSKNSFSISNNIQNFYVLEGLIFKLNDFSNICNDSEFRKNYSKKLRKYYHSRIVNIFNDSSELYALIEIYTYVMYKIYSKKMEIPDKKIFTGEKDQEFLDSLKHLKYALTSEKSNLDRRHITNIRILLDHWVEDDDKYFKLSLKTIWSIEILRKLLTYNNIGFIKRACSIRLNGEYNSFWEFYKASFRYFKIGIEGKVFELLFIILNIWLPFKKISEYLCDKSKKRLIEVISRDQFAIYLMDDIIERRELRLQKMNNCALNIQYLI